MSKKNSSTLVSSSRHVLRLFRAYLARECELEDDSRIWADGDAIDITSLSSVLDTFEADVEHFAKLEKLPSDPRLDSARRGFSDFAAALAKREKEIADNKDLELILLARKWRPMSIGKPWRVVHPMGDIAESVGEPVDFVSREEAEAGLRSVLSGRPAWTTVGLRVLDLRKGRGK